MLKAAPEVHSDGADLDLYLYIALFIGKIYRDRHNKMKAAIAVGGLDTVVFLTADQGNVILAQKDLGDLLKVIHIVTDNSDTCDIADILAHILEIYLFALLVELLNYALRALEAGVDMMDGVVLIMDMKTVVKILKLGLHLLDGRAIDLHLAEKILHHFGRNGRRRLLIVIHWLVYIHYELLLFVDGSFNIYIIPLGTRKIYKTVVNCFNIIAGHGIIETSKNI